MQDVGYNPLDFKKGKRMWRVEKKAVVDARIVECCLLLAGCAERSWRAKWMSNSPQ